MNISNRITDWLETRWVTPAFSGWLLGTIAVCFFGAAVNTMVGWLYALSGISLALLIAGAFLAVRSLRDLRITRKMIQPVTVGDKLTIELQIESLTKEPKILLMVQDRLQSQLGKPVQTPIELVSPGGGYQWVYYQETQKRGVYRWHSVQIRTGAPLGLFWCRRSWDVPATAIVYPTVLPLSRCPLVDEIGQEESAQQYSRDRQSQMATEGITRALRPYRVGDPTRLIHWRTSARYGELKVRELEVFTAGQEIIISIDTASTWNADDFEQAVIAAASLYFYAGRSQLNVKLWTASTGLLQGNRVVLETLAAIYPDSSNTILTPPNLPLIWLTQNPLSLTSLPKNSRWVLWPTTSSAATLQNRNYPGILINAEQPLQHQLQSPLS